MRRLPFRTQLVVLVGVFLGVFSGVAGTFFWFQSKVYDRMERSFSRDVTALADVARLRGALHRIDLTADNFLLSEDRRWLEERRAEIEITESTMERLSASAANPTERTAWEHLTRNLRRHVAVQDVVLERRRAGRLSADAAEQAVMLDISIDRLFRELATIRDFNAWGIEAYKLWVQRASLLMFALVAFMGLALTLLAAHWLSRRIVLPLERMGDQVRLWELGGVWRGERIETTREMSFLSRGLNEMAVRLSREFEKEQELGRLKSRLVSMVSHEFVNALNIIQLAAHYVETPPAGSEVSREELFQMIYANVAALFTTVHTLLDLGRLEAGRFTLNRKAIDVRATLRRVVEALDLLIKRKNLEVRLDLPEAMIRVDADPDVLALVFSNLVSNAIKFTPEGGRITAGLRPEDPAAVRVFVKDTGIGISPADQERIFSGYYRTAQAEKTAKGFGLGLSVVKKLIEAHGSALQLESEPGKGSNFFFTLPVAQPAAAPGPAGSLSL